MRTHRGRTPTAGAVTARTSLIALLLVVLAACGAPPQPGDPQPDPTPDPQPTNVRMNDASCAAGAYVGVGSTVFDDARDEARFPEDGTSFGSRSVQADASVSASTFDGRVASDATCAMTGSNAIGVSGISASGTVILIATEGGPGGSYAGGYAEYVSELRIGTRDDTTGAWSGESTSVQLTYLAGPGIAVRLESAHGPLVDSTTMDTGSHTFNGDLAPGEYSVEGRVTVDLTGASLRDGARSFEFEMTLR